MEKALIDYGTNAGNIAMMHGGVGMATVFFVIHRFAKGISRRLRIALLGMFVYGVTLFTFRGFWFEAVSHAPAGYPYAPWALDLWRAPAAIGAAMGKILGMCMVFYGFTTARASEVAAYGIALLGLAGMTAAAKHITGQDWWVYAGVLLSFLLTAAYAWQVGEASERG